MVPDLGEIFPANIAPRCDNYGVSLFGKKPPPFQLRPRVCCLTPSLSPVARHGCPRGLFPMNPFPISDREFFLLLPLVDLTHFFFFVESLHLTRDLCNAGLLSRPSEDHFAKAISLFSHRPRYPDFRDESFICPPGTPIAHCPLVGKAPPSLTQHWTTNDASSAPKRHCPPPFPLVSRTPLSFHQLSLPFPECFLYQIRFPPENDFSFRMSSWPPSTNALPDTCFPILGIFPLNTSLNLGDSPHDPPSS